MIYQYKVIINNLVEVPAAYNPTLCENQPPRGHQKQFVRLQPNVGTFKLSLLPRTDVLVGWNNLDELPWQVPRMKFCMGPQRHSHRPCQFYLWTAHLDLIDLIDRIRISIQANHYYYRVRLGLDLFPILTTPPKVKSSSKMYSEPNP